MRVIDAQVHAYTSASKEYPWSDEFVRRIPERVRENYDIDRSPERLLAMMEAVGIDVALLTSPFVYGADHSYSIDAACRYPGRFGVVGPMFPSTPNVGDRTRAFREQPWAVGIRVIRLPDDPEPVTGDAYRKIFAAAEEGRVPLFIMAMGALRELESIARDHPALLMIVDHLGLTMPEKVTDPFVLLPDLLNLAQFGNVAVKCSGVPEFSTQGYPFKDVLGVLRQVISEFGPQRVMWGSDITQHRTFTYGESLDYLRRSDELSDLEKEWILGRTATELLRLHELGTFA